MSEVDSLEIKITSSVEEANKSINSLIKNIGNLTKAINIDTSRISGIGKSASQSIKPIQEETRKISKTFDQIKDPFKDIGKGFRISGGTNDIQKSIQKYENELEKAKLKEQELSAKGKTDTSGYRDAVADVVKYQNIIESLKKQLEEINSTKIQIDRNDSSGKSLSEYEEELSRLKDGIKSISDAYKGFENIPKGQLDIPIENLSLMLSELKSDFPDATRQISMFEEELKNLKEAASDITREPIRQKVDTSSLDKMKEARERAENFKSALNSLKDIRPAINETNITKLENRLKSVIQQAENLKYEMEKGLRFGNISDKQFDNLTIKIRESENEAEALKAKIEEIRNVQSVDEKEGMFSRISSSVRKSLGSISSFASGMKKVLSGIDGAKSKITGLAKSMLGLKTSSNGINASFAKNLRTILKYGLGIRSLYVLFNKLRSGIRDGMKNLVQYSAETNASVSLLSNSMNQLKNASAAMVAPLLNALAPALDYIIQMCISAANAINQLISVLTGKGTWIRAKKQTQDFAKGIAGTGGAAKKAKKELNGYIAGWHEVNNMTSKDDSGGGGGGGGGALSASDMFETVDISDNAKKIGKILSDLFRPFREAWERDGKSVIDAAKYALSSIGELAKSVGKSFMEVWTNGTGTKVISELLQITKNLLTVIGNIASRLDDAWNTNEVGTRIIQNIFDIFISILDTINRITDSTARWAEKLDFTPLLESINTLLEAVKPLTDTIGEGLEWFWNNVLLPIAGWTIEDAVPAFLNMLASAIDALNKVIEALKPAAKWFWDNFLKPLGEWTGELIISAMETITELLKKFSDWITENKDEVSQFATIVGIVGGAFLGVSGAIAIVSGVLPILAAAIGGVVSIITSPVGIVAALAAMVVAAGNGDEMIKTLKDTLEGIKDFVVGVFTGDWKTAWEGIEKTATGVLDIIKLSIDSVKEGLLELLSKLDEAGGYGTGFAGKLVNKIKPRTVNTGMQYSLDIPHFASGGFPEDGWFRAGHGEIMGRFDNGQSVVANNRQITDGISAAVYSGNQENNMLMREEISLLQRQNEILTKLLQKDTGISKNDIGKAAREYSSEYFKRTGRQAFSY